MTSLRGMFVAMAAPFDEQSAINQRNVGRSVEFNVPGGGARCGACAGRSEFHTLTDGERLIVTKLTVDAVLDHQVQRALAHTIIRRTTLPRW